MTALMVEMVLSLFQNNLYFMPARQCFIKFCKAASHGFLCWNAELAILVAARLVVGGDFCCVVCFAERTQNSRQNTTRAVLAATTQRQHTKTPPIRSASTRAFFWYALGFSPTYIELNLPLKGVRV